MLEETWEALPFVANIGYILFLIPEVYTTRLILLAIVTGLIFLVILLSHFKIRRKASETEGNKDEMGEKSKDNTSNNTRNPVIILAEIYGVVAGFAITQALEKASVPLQGQARSPLELVASASNEFLLLLIFLSIAIPFYHGASMFLFTVAKEGLRKVRKGEVEIVHEGKALFDFIMLFTEGSLLFAMALTLNVFSAFLGWTVLLMAVDAFWLLVSFAKHDYSVPIEWLYLDIPFIIFLVLLPSAGVELQTVLLVVLIISLFRSVVDYKVAWRLIYFKPLH